MTAITEPRPIRTRPGHQDHPMLGFDTFIRKEIAEWIRGRRAIVVGLIATALALLGTMGTWIEQNVEGVTTTGAADPTVEALRFFGPPIVALLTIFATMGLIASERDAGTLAWSLSKPLSPVSILAAKWTAAVAILAIVVVIIPTAIAATAATLAYGAAPDLSVVAPVSLLSIAVPVLYVTISIAAGTILSSQAGIAGVGITVMLLPYLIGAFLPAVVFEAMPTGIGAWVAGLVGGDVVPMSTPVVWLATVAILAAVALAVFRRREF